MTQNLTHKLGYFTFLLFSTFFYPPSVLQAQNCTSATTYQFYNDGAGSFLALYGANISASGVYSSTLLNSESNSGFGSQAHATVDGNVFWELFNDGSGTQALYRSKRQSNGTVGLFLLLNADCGALASTIDFATADGTTFYFLVNDGVGSAALYSGVLGTDGVFAMTLLNADSNAPTNTVAMGTTDGITFELLVNDGSGSLASYSSVLGGGGTFTNTLLNAESGSGVTTESLASAIHSVQLTSNSPVCAGERLLINAANDDPMGNLTYNWSGPNGFTSTAQNPEILNFSAAKAGTYSVTVTYSNGNTGTCSINTALSTDCNAACNCREYVYVNDFINNLTHKFEVQRNTAGSLVEVGSPWLPYNGSQINSPHGVSIDPNGNLYIAELGESKYVRLDCDGNIITPTAEAKHGYNHVIIGNYAYIVTSNFVEVYNLYDASTNFVGWVRLGSIENTNTDAWGLAYNKADGLLYVTDNYAPLSANFTANGGDVYAINPANPQTAGTVWQLNSTINPVISNLQQTMGITFDAAGNMYVVDQTAHFGTTTIRKYTKSGSTWNQVGSVTDNTDSFTGFYNSWGITWSQTSNKLYVTSFSDDCVATINAATMAYEGATVPHVAGATAKAISLISECCYNGPSTINTVVCQGDTVLLRDLLGCDQCGGTWTRASGTGGTFNTSSLTFIVGAGTTSTSFTYTSNNEQCGPTSVTINITVGQPEAGTGSTLTICNAQTSTMDLFGLLTGETTGGYWVAATSNPSGGAFNAAGGTFNPTGASNGTYNFTYKFDATANCVADQATVQIIISNPPTGMSASATVCDNSTSAIDLFSLIAAGDLPGGTWTRTAGTGGTFNATAGTFTPAVGMASSTFTYSSPCPGVTSTVTVTVNTVNGGAIASDQTVCAGGDPAAFTNPTAGTVAGTRTYRWESSTTDCITGFTTISGATAATYNPPAGITQTTYYRRITISTLNGVACEAASNCVTVTVNPTPNTPSVLSPQMNTCPATTVNLNTISAALTPSVLGGVFEWHISNSSGSAMVSNPTSVGLGTYYLFEKSPSGCYSTGAPLQVQIQNCCPSPLCLPVTITRSN